VAGGGQGPHHSDLVGRQVRRLPRVAAAAADVAVRHRGEDLLGDDTGMLALAALCVGDQARLQADQLVGGVALGVDPGRDRSPIGSADGVADRGNVLLVGVGDLDDLPVGGQELVGQVFDLGRLGAGGQLLAYRPDYIAPAEGARLLGQPLGAGKVGEDGLAVASGQWATVGLPQHGGQVVDVEAEFLSALPPTAPQGLLVDCLALA
jgi:hypothetical protein